MATSTRPPGPPPAGNIFQVMRLVNKLNADSLGTFAEWSSEYGDIFALSIMNMQQWIVTHPDLIHQILVTDASKFIKDAAYSDEKRGLARFLGNGLLTSDGEFWKRQRKLVAPSLHTRRIEAYAQTMVDYTLKMLDGWQDKARLDISQEMSALTMQIVAKTLFNANVVEDIAAVNSSMATLQKASGDMTLLPEWVPTPIKYRSRQAVSVLDRIVYGFINERRASGEDKGDLLSMLLLAQDDDGNGMSDKQARDEAVTLFLAGHETTANSLNWTWYLLAQHPEVEAKLHAELDSVLAGSPPSLDDLKNLPYTEMIMKESMRLYPPAWSFSREATEDIQLGDYIIPKGTVVAILNYFTHRDPRWWDDPEAFVPERFSPEREKDIPKYAYVPFGGGPRVCIGNSFAMMEGRLLLATMASRYSLTLQPGQKVQTQPLITLNPKNGLPMTLHARQPVAEMAF